MNEMFTKCLLCAQQWCKGKNDIVLSPWGIIMRKPQGFKKNQDSICQVFMIEPY